MKQRINIEHANPQAFKAVIRLATILENSTLSPIQKHLIKIRVSQINACAFCIDMHTKEALHAGETQQRIFLLSAWKETNLFSEEEKALLALTEEVTLIHQQGITDDTYSNAERFFSAQTLADIILAAIMMNSLNRMAISSQLGMQLAANDPVLAN